MLELALSRLAAVKGWEKYKKNGVENVGKTVTSGKWRETSGGGKSTRHK